MAERFIYTGNDDRPIEVPASANITPYNEDGTFTQELKDFIALQREQGNYLDSSTTIITRPTQRDAPDSIMPGVVPSKSQAERYRRSQEEIDIENKILADQQRSERLSEASDIYAAGLNLPEAEEAEEKETSTYTEIAKSITKAGVNTGQALADVASIIDRDGDWFGRTPEEREQRRREATRRTAKAASKGFSFGWLPDVEMEDLYDPDTGKVVPAEGFTGLATDFGLMLSGYGALGKINAIKNIKSPIVREVTKAFVLENALFNPEDGNLFTLLEEVFVNPESGKSLNWAQQAIEYLSTDPDDSRATARLKQQIDVVGLGVAFELLGNSFFRKKGYEMYDTRAENLTNEQRVNIVASELDEARQLAALAKQQGTTKINISETDEGVQKILNQSKSFWKGGGFTRLSKIFFSSDGFLSRSGKNLLDESVFAQRAAMQNATNVATRLQLKLDSLMSSNSLNEYLPEQIQKVLTSDFKMPRVINDDNYEDVVQDLIDQFSIPRDIAPEVIESRLLIDDMSRKMLHSDFVDDGVKEVINENVGAYLRRSYHAYETAGYTPSIDVRINAEDFLKNQILNDRSEMLDIENLVYKQYGVNVSPDDLNNYMDDIINTRISDSINEMLDNDIFEYTDKSRTLNKYIFKAKQDIPPEIRALLGEIEDPALNVRTTIEKMSKFYEVGRFHSNLNEIANGKYIFDDKVARDTKVFTTQINMPNSPLNGKWTTPEVAASLQNNAAWNPGGIIDSEFFKNFATAKGTSQQAKTVLSIATQARNAAGGVQFGLANGVWPFKDGVNTNAVLWNKMLKSGDEALDEQYTKYQRLGVINTNVRLSEFQDLLRIGEESTADTLFSSLRNIPYGGQVLDKTIDGATEVYMATDDFFKMNNFERELETLQKAFPNESLDVLEQEAARKVKNTFPNYDRVPAGVKALRFLPMGNFVSFPAEIWRTSYNIITEASKEIASSNPVLKERGLQRLSGYMLSMGSWQGAATASALTYGLSDEQQDNIHKVTETPWNGGSTRNIVRVEDKFYTQDTTNYNSYNTIRAPLMEALEDVRTGKLQGEELDQVLTDTGITFVGSLLEPFVSESMLAKSLLDVKYAVANNGVRPDGSRAFSVGENPIAAIAEGVLTPFMPGTIEDAYDLYQIAAGNVNEYSGKLPEWQGELVSSLLGIRFQEVDPVEALRFKYREFNELKSNFINPSYPNFRENADDIIEQVDTNLQLQYKAVQDLYSTYQAVQSLLDEDSTYGQAFTASREGREEELSPLEMRSVTAQQVLKDAGASSRLLMSMEDGRFLDTTDVLNFIKQSFDRGTPFADEILEEQAQDKLDELTKTAKKYLTVPLNFDPEIPIYMDLEETKKVPTGFGATQELIKIREAEEKAREARGSFAIGGEVYNVPQAPVEPDERIDKLTGFPYNEQAGEAYIDEEERKMFSVGGRIKNALAKLIGRGPEKQMNTFIEAVNLNNELVDKGLLKEDQRLKYAEWEMTKDKKGNPVPMKDERNYKIPKRFLTEEEVRNFNRDDIAMGISGNEEAFNAIQHAILGYDNAYLTSPLIQGRELLSAKEQIDLGQDPRTEHGDRWNNSFGIDARRRGIPREEFKYTNIVNSLVDFKDGKGTKYKMQNNIPLERGRDLITNMGDVPPDFISETMDRLGRAEQAFKERNDQ
tara:strand:- start:1368 stop:6344 length:4977 start_codon:yes stop_codon:yes gene_type:complete